MAATAMLCKMKLILSRMACTGLSFVVGLKKVAERGLKMNPILPKKYYVPDVEARQWKDGRTYLYGSLDVQGDTSYCSYQYRVFSSEGLLHWEDHGVSFRGRGAGEDVAAEPGILYAPDCIYKDGIYYLYYCQDDGKEGVAASIVPAGPFTNAQPVAFADKRKLTHLFLLMTTAQRTIFGDSLMQWGLS